MKTRRGMSKKSGNRYLARGAAIVEFAVVSPMLFAIVFGIIEFGWRLMAKQTMVQASQVAARTASLPGSTDSEILAAVQGHLETAGHPFTEEGVYDVDITHATPGDPTETVTISIPRSKVSLTNFFGTPTGLMSVTTVVPKEGQF